jgi:hypothetical protein
MAEPSAEIQVRRQRYNGARVSTLAASSHPFSVCDSVDASWFELDGGANRASIECHADMALVLGKGSASNRKP